MHVAHFEAGAIARETTRPKGGETAFVGQFRQWVNLVHELTELAAAKEIADDRRERLGIDQLLRVMASKP